MHVLQASRAPLSMEDLRARFPDYAQGTPEASRRKIERDKAELAAIGLVLRYVSGESDGPDGYTLDRTASYLPEVDLSPREHALLALAARSALEEPSFPHRPALRLALAKLRADPDDAAGPIRLAIHTADSPADIKGKIEIISEAITRRKALDVVYQRPNRDTTERRIDPYGAFLKQGSWYLVGYDHRSEEVRTFRVSRTRDLRPNPKRPTQPDYELPTDFDLRAAAKLDPLRFPVHDPLDAIVMVDTEVRFLAERSWGVAPDKDGQFHLRTTNIEALVDQVLRLGRRAELLKPASARVMIAEALDAIVEGHGGER